MRVAKELDVVQGSDEWLEARLGLVTSSEIKNITAKNRDGSFTAARKRYRTQLVLERLTGKSPSRYKSREMEWGSETEDLAATMYSLETGNEIRQCGILLHNDYAIGDSPDRIITSLKGTVEIKCFESSNHQLAIRSGHMPLEHKPQVMNHIYMNDSDFCDFVSFDPDFPEHAQLFIERIYRDDKYIKEQLVEILIFLEEVDEEVNFIKKLKRKQVIKLGRK